MNIKTFKILIVDDEEMLQDLFEMIFLSEFQCQITKANNGKEAMDKLKQGEIFDLIVSDYKMPVANGGELCLFNMTNSNFPFFLFSGGELEDYPELLKFKDSNRYNRFFSKPFDERQVIEATRIIYNDKA